MTAKESCHVQNWYLIGLFMSKLELKIIICQRSAHELFVKWTISPWQHSHVRIWQKFVRNLFHNCLLCNPFFPIIASLATQVTVWLKLNIICQRYTVTCRVHPKNYVHELRVLLWFLVVTYCLISPIFFRVASLALGQYDCPNANEAT